MYCTYIEISRYVSERSGAFAVAGPGYMGPMGAGKTYHLVPKNMNLKPIISCYRAMNF